MNVPNFKYNSDKNAKYSYVGYELIKGCELSSEILYGLNKADYKKGCKGS